MTKNELKKVDDKKLIDIAKKAVDYSDIAIGGLQSILDNVVGMASSLRSYNEHVATNASECDLRTYLKSICSQIDSVALQASIINDCLLQHHDGEMYSMFRDMVSKHYSEETKLAIAKQRINETINFAKKYGFLKELHAAIAKADVNSKNPKKESK